MSPILFNIYDQDKYHRKIVLFFIVFSAVRKGARARTYENALIWLEGAGLIHKANAVEVCKHPLKHYADTSCFKIYALDVGLLGAMARSPFEIL